MKQLIILLLLSTAACNSKDTCNIGRDNTGKYRGIIISNSDTITVIGHKAYKQLKDSK